VRTAISDTLSVAVRRSGDAGIGDGQAQALAMHVRPPVQIAPQPPQFDASVRVSTHDVPHAVCPVGQRQTPPEQAVPLGHTRPHAPQFAGSAASDRQVSDDAQ
jgi:hypothetical protein